MPPVLSTREARMENIKVSTSSCKAILVMITIQEYISTITVEDCHKLIIEAYSHVGGVELAKSLVQHPPSPPPPNQNVPWCTCRKCRSMDQPIERDKCHALQIQRHSTWWF